MWSYVVTWLPLLSISLTAAICFGVASFVNETGKTSYRALLNF
jgi:hypothetical protein